MASENEQQSRMFQPQTTRPHGELNTVLDTLGETLNQTRGVDIHIDMGGHENESSNTQEARPQQQTQEAHIHPLVYVLPYLKKYGVFILIILLKILYNHRYGLLIIVAALAGWFHLDSVLRAQITLRHHNRYKQLASKLALVMFISAINIVVIYVFFDDMGILSRRLIFTSFGADKAGFSDLWTLLHVLILNDLAIKYAVLIIKSIITLIPKTVITDQRKGNLYSFLELSTQFYRSLLPIIPWYYFLLGNSDGVWFSVILFIIYVVFKFMSFYAQFEPWKKSVSRLCRETTYGVKPTQSELAEAGENCPVCHDEYNCPIALTCKHIFCEDCVSVWFDKERTCPMCRAQILTEECHYKDGSGNPMIQFY